MPFDIITLAQGTSDWLDWRHDGIGASEADAILGRNPWRSRARVLRDKAAPRAAGSFTNGAMARGTALEPLARRHYCRQTGRNLEPACLQSRTHGWLRASVDGICTASRTLVEIKCGEKAWAQTERTGAPPDYYAAQLQHILAVTGYASIHFWCFLPDRTPLLVPVVRDDAFIAAMLASEETFWAEVTALRDSGLYPPARVTPRRA